jgi:hypothetical protein
MIAICPAGPPKLIQPSFSQNRSASRKLGFPSITRAHALQRAAQTAKLQM